MTIHWILWLLMCNVSIAFIEYTYRAGQYTSFFAALPYIAVPILVSQWGLFEGFKAAPSLFVAGSVFSIINVAFRIGNTYILHEHLNVVNWIGVGMLVGSVILLRVK